MPHQFENGARVLSPCGTNAAYKRGCRCQLCKDAHATDARGRENKSGYDRRWRANNPDKVAEYLKTARRKRYIVRYNFTLEQRDDLLAKQDNKCALCRTAEPGKRGWMVDHDHETGKVRGILCSPCNTGLGLFGDDPALMREAADYVEKHKQTPEDV